MAAGENASPDLSPPSSYKSPSQRFMKRYDTYQREKRENPQKQLDILLNRLTSCDDPTVDSVIESVKGALIFTQCSGAFKFKGMIEILMVNSSNPWSPCQQSKLYESFPNAKKTKCYQRPILEQSDGHKIYLVYSTLRNPTAKEEAQEPAKKTSDTRDKDVAEMRMEEDAVEEPPPPKNRRTTKINHDAVLVAFHNHVLRRAICKCDSNQSTSAIYGAKSYDPTNSMSCASLNSESWTPALCAEIDRGLVELAKKYELEVVGFASWTQDQGIHLRTVYANGAYTNEERNQTKVQRCMEKVDVNLDFDFKKAITTKNEFGEFPIIKLQMQYGYEIIPKIGFGMLSHRASIPWSVHFYERAMFRDLGEWATIKNCGKFKDLPDFVTFMKARVKVSYLSFCGLRLLHLVFYVALRTLKSPDAKSWTFVKNFIYDMERTITDIVRCCDLCYDVIDFQGETLGTFSTMDALVEGVCRSAVTGPHNIDIVLNKLLENRSIQVVGNLQAHIPAVMFEHVKVIADIATTNWDSTTIDLSVLSKIHHAALALLYFFNGEADLKVGQAQHTLLRFGYLLANQPINRNCNEPMTSVDWQNNIDENGVVMLKPNALEMDPDDLKWLQEHLPIDGSLLASASFPQFLQAAMNVVIHTHVNCPLVFPLAEEDIIQSQRSFYMTLSSRAIRRNIGMATDLHEVIPESAFKRDSVLREPYVLGAANGRKFGVVPADEVAKMMVYPRSTLGCLLRYAIPNGTENDAALVKSFAEFIGENFEVMHWKSLDEEQKYDAFYTVVKTKREAIDAAEAFIGKGLKMGLYDFHELPGYLRQAIACRSNARMRSKKAKKRKKDDKEAAPTTAMMPIVIKEIHPVPLAPRRPPLSGTSDERQDDDGGESDGATEEDDNEFDPIECDEMKPKIEADVDVEQTDTLPKIGGETHEPISQLKSSPSSMAKTEMKVEQSSPTSGSSSIEFIQEMPAKRRRVSSTSQKKAESYSQSSKVATIEIISPDRDDDDEDVANVTAELNRSLKVDQADLEVICMPSPDDDDEKEKTTPPGSRPRHQQLEIDDDVGLPLLVQSPIFQCNKKKRKRNIVRNGEDE